MDCNRKWVGGLGFFGAIVILAFSFGTRHFRSHPGDEPSRSDDFGSPTGGSRRGGAVLTVRDDQRQSHHREGGSINVRRGGPGRACPITLVVVGDL